MGDERKTLLALGLFVFLAGTVIGFPWAEAEKTAVRLFSATNSVGDSRQNKLDLYFRMKAG